MDNKKITSFTGLDTWKEGHKLVLMIYDITKKFPKEEIFGLVSQMRRAAVSITSNIAEGFSRNGVKEKIQFYSVARGSNVEIQNQLLIAKDIKYIDKESFNKIAEQSIKVNKLINGMIRYCRDKN